MLRFFVALDVCDCCCSSLLLLLVVVVVVERFECLLFGLCVVVRCWPRVSCELFAMLCRLFGVCCVLLCC